MAASTAQIRPDRTWVAPPKSALLVVTFLVAAVIYFAGLIQNLPYDVEIDEPTRVVRAVAMVRDWNLNPGWFGHPASTVFYPLALLIYLYNALALGGSFFQPNPALQGIFEANPSPFYILGRLITVGYGLGSLPLIYLIGRRLFSPWTGLVGVWMSLTFTVVISHAQVVRSDSAALFFALLSLWLCLQFYDYPSMANRLRCALAIGLAVSSRYLMVAYVLPLAVAELALLWRSRQLGQSPLGKPFLRACLSPVGVLAGFALSSPFFFLDFATVQKDLVWEARSEWLGADGLSPVGNFWWYVTRALPEAISWPYLVLGLLAVFVAVWQRRHLQVLFGAFIFAYLVGISLHSLHWQRWLIQVIPLIGLLSAEAVVFLHGVLVQRLALKGAQAGGLLAGLILAALVVPAVDMILFEIRQVAPSTRVQAMRWMEDNLPPGSHVLQEEMCSAPLPPYLDHTLSFQLGRRVTLADYRKQGVDYLVVNDGTYKDFFDEPRRYAGEVALFTEVFTTLPLVKRFEPSPVRPGVVPNANASPCPPGGGGPVISIYRLSDEDEPGTANEHPSPRRYYADALARIEQLEGGSEDTTVYFHLTSEHIDAFGDELIRLGRQQGLRVRIAARPETLLLDGEGDDHIYVLEATDLATAERLLQLGFVEMAEEQVTLSDGRRGLRFFRLNGLAEDAIVAHFTQVAPQVRLSNGLRLDRWQAPTDLRGQAALPLAAAWQAWDEPKSSENDSNWCLSHHLLDVEGKSLAVADSSLGPARFLKKGDTLLTWLSMPLPTGLGLQQSSLALGMFSCWKRDTAAVLGQNGEPVSGGLAVGPFKVGGGTVTVAGSPFRFPVQAVLGGEIQLNSYDAWVQGGPGGALRLALHWQAENRPQADYTVFVQLLRDGKLVAQQDSPPRAGRYPTSIWDRGEEVVDEYELALPEGLTAGEYRLIAGMYTPAEVRRLPVTGADGRPLGDVVDLGVLTVGPSGETAFRQR